MTLFDLEVVWIQISSSELQKKSIYLWVSSLQPNKGVTSNKQSIYHLVLKNILAHI